MVEWYVTVTYVGDLDEATQNALDDDLEAREASTGRIPERHQFTVGGWAEAARPAAATRAVLDLTGRTLRRHRITAPIVAVETMTGDELAARNATPNYPELVSATEAGEILGVSRQRVHQLAAEHADFPEPLHELGAGNLWTASAIRGFARQWTRKPGRRPAKHAG
jgi:hypothetical protein